MMFKTYKCHLDYLWLFAGNPFNMIRVLAVHQEPPASEPILSVITEAYACKLMF
ncbi:hypothetical protein J21TS7_09950 [Paenibacillus cineris]|uniref:Uncharacterized protein n=1 Tax=Paenibacillus cineris TaxID=237530 RepID=A0ABQ4L864_9BACL|nr:hypothetical protein J21TS7_09950 [Paenibacillus cineris]GIO62706.1 hypothetical protein J43TS9_42800 [Paenibacillus cineris]